MPTNKRKETTFAAAAHYAIYLGLFWVFRYLFLMGAEYNALYKYIFDLLIIGTPILFYALACVYRERRLGGSIVFGKVVSFGIFLFLFASFLEAVVIAINIIYVNPAYLSNFEEEVCSFYEKIGISEHLLSLIEEGFKIGPFTFIVLNMIYNTILGLIMALLLGFFIAKKKPQKNKNS